MTVIVLEKAPPSLRGQLRKWLIEVSCGVFVGNISRLVRDKLWYKIEENCNDAHVIMVYSYANEQGFKIESHNPGDYVPIDFEGLTLILRPIEED